MIRSLILMTGTRYLVPLILLFAVFIFFRGHNEPGGGFVGGLLASSAFVLYLFAFGYDAARRFLAVHPRTLIFTGLAVAVGSALIGPIFYGTPFMTGIWWDALELPAIGKLGTPLFFDVGVMLTVIGVTTTIVFTLAESDTEF